MTAAASSTLGRLDPRLGLALLGREHTERRPAGVGDPRAVVVGLARAELREGDRVEHAALLLAVALAHLELELGRGRHAARDHRPLFEAAAERVRVVAMSGAATAAVDEHRDALVVAAAQSRGLVVPGDLADARVRRRGLRRRLLGLRRLDRDLDRVRSGRRRDLGLVRATEDEERDQRDVSEAGDDPESSSQRGPQSAQSVPSSQRL